MPPVAIYLAQHFCLTTFYSLSLARSLSGLPRDLEERV